MRHVPRNTTFSWRTPGKTSRRQAAFEKNGAEIAKEIRQKIYDECGRLLDMLQSLPAVPRNDQREIEMLLGYAEVSKEGQGELLDVAHQCICRLQRRPIQRDSRHLEGMARL